jgi:hypothetical protein
MADELLAPENSGIDPTASVAPRRSSASMMTSDSILPARPLVVDSDVLMRNVVREVPGLPPTKLLNHIRMGTVRAYIAPHLVGEVRKHLPRVAHAAGVDPSSAIAMFEHEFEQSVGVGKIVA